MENKEDKELEALLAAYLDGELEIDESRDLLRRLESGDLEVQSQLAMLRSVRAEASEWAQALREEMSGVDLWPVLEAKLRAEQKSLAIVVGKPFLSRLFASKNQSEQTFSRGFSWGFAGGFAMAGCASFAALLLVQTPSQNSDMFAGKEMVPLRSTGLSTSGGAEIAGNAARVSLEAPQVSSVRDGSLALVSAGKDMGSEAYANGAIYELPADLFAGVRARERERRVLAEAFPDSFSVQLLSPGNISPPGIGESEVFARAAREKSADSAPGSSGEGSALASLTSGAQGTRSFQPSPVSSPADVTWVSNARNGAEVH